MDVFALKGFLSLVLKLKTNSKGKKYIVAVEPEFSVVVEDEPELFAITFADRVPLWRSETKKNLKKNCFQKLFWGKQKNIL